MNITTPLMYARKFIPSEYIDNIYVGFGTARGSGQSIQCDFTDLAWIPDNTFTRNSDKTFDCNDSAPVATTNTNKQIAAGEDVVMVMVGDVLAVPGTCIFTVGSPATNGIGLRFETDRVTNTTGPIVKDGTTSITASQTRSDTLANPSAGDTVLLACAWDRSEADGLAGYMYNITTGTVMEETFTAVATPNQASNNATTPSQAMRLSNMNNVRYAGVFTFTSNGLPATWAADMLTLANNVIALKG